MNEEVSGKQKDGDTIKDSDHFKKQYAMVLVQLRDANDQVCLSMKFHPFIGFYSFFVLSFIHLLVFILFCA